MIARLFRRNAPDTRDETVAEALDLLEAGLPMAEVLAMFERDRDWLAPELAAVELTQSGFAAVEPTPEFSGLLRARVLHHAAQAGRNAPEIVAADRPGMFRLAGVASVVASSMAVAGALFFGVLTADDSVPGDWNYAFKIAGERVQYATSRGQDRLELRVRFAQERVEEIAIKVQSGEQVSPEELAKVTREWVDLEMRVRQQTEISPKMQEQLVQAATQTRETLQEIKTITSTTAPPNQDPQVSVSAAVDDTLAAVDSAVAAGTGNVFKPLPEPTAQPTQPAPSPTPAADASPTGTTPAGTPSTPPTGAAPAGTGTATALVPGSPTAEATEPTPPEPTVTLTETPTPTETETETPSETPEEEPSEEPVDPTASQTVDDSSQTETTSSATSSASPQVETATPTPTATPTAENAP